MPQVRVKSGVHVNKPPAEVFAFLCDPDRIAQWQASSHEVRGHRGTTGQGKLQRGSAVQDRRNILGKEIDAEWEVVDFDQDRRVVFRIIRGPISWEATFTLEPEDGGTHLSGEAGGDLGQLPMNDNAARRSAQRMFDTDLETLAHILST